MNRTLQLKGRVTLAFFILFFLFLSSLNLINRYYYFVFIAFFLFAIKPGRRFFGNKSLLPLFLLGVFWVILSPSTSVSLLSPLKPFSYLLCFIMGYGFNDDIEPNPDGSISFKPFYLLAGVLASGTLAHYLLNWIKNGDALDRNTVDIWMGENIAATGQASLACLPLALALACIFSKNSKGIKVIAWIALTIVLGYNLVLAGRTLILLFVIILAFAFLHRLFTRKSGKLLAILILLFAIAAVLLIYQFNLFGVRDLVESSSLYDRFFGKNSMDLGEDGRLEKKLFYLKNMLRYPFGGTNMREEVGHAHDLYLDTYDEAGMIAFLAIVVYVGATIRRLWLCITNKALPFVFRQIVFCTYLTLYIEFMIEPILQGMPWLFASFCLLDGCVARLLKTVPGKTQNLSSNQTQQE